MSRRRSRSGQLLTIYWRDIPAQVTASRGADTARALLTDRFQHAIDRAATVAGLTDTDAYVNEWRREIAGITGDVEAEAQGEADRIEAAYPRDRLEQLVRNGGLDPVAPDTDPTHTVATGDQIDPVGGSQ